MKDLSLNGATEGQITLYDRDYNAAINNIEVGERIFKINDKENYKRFTIKAEEHIDKALTNANLVIISIEPGDTSCRKGDIEIPEEYGILETVGDTTGPGGIMRARRALPLFFEFGLKIKECCPNAWVINYTNPMTLCTAALFKVFPKIKLLGCCHEVFGTQHFIANLVSKWFDVPTPDRREIHLDITGINHFTFATKIEWKGIDLYPKLIELANNKDTYKDLTLLAKQRIKEEEWFDCNHLIALQMLRQFGALGAAGDRHLAEFTPYFLTSEKDIWKYGIMRTPYSWRERISIEKKNKTFKDEELIAKPSDEEGVDIMMSLMGKRTLFTNMNRLNVGQVPFLPLGTVVESNGFISENSIKPVVSSNPPLAIQTLIKRIVDVQQMTLEAIWNKDNEALFTAFTLDPLVHLPIHKAREMFDKMVVACALKY